MSSIESISQYIYPDNEQQQAEFVQEYRAKSALKRTMLKELLPNLSDTQIAEVLHEYTVKRAHRSIARNHRLRFVREFLYRTGLDSLIRYFKRHYARTENAQSSDSSPLQLDSRTVTKLRKTVTQIAREYKRDYKRDYKRSIKSPRPNLATEHTTTVESQAS